MNEDHPRPRGDAVSAASAEAVAREIVSQVRTSWYEHEAALKAGGDRWPVWEAWELVIREKIDAYARERERAVWEEAAKIAEKTCDLTAERESGKPPRTCHWWCHKDQVRQFRARLHAGATGGGR